MDSLKGLDLNLLVVFEAVYTSENITHAAKSLGLTQPTISNALVRLREAVDDPLFVRKGKGVEPTPRAKSMIGPVRSALQLIQTGVSAGEEFDPTRNARHFRIVLLDQLEPILMPYLVRDIQTHSNVTLEVLPIAYEPMIEGLNDGSLDMVLAPHIPELKEAIQEVVGNASTVMVARQGHPEINGKLTLEQYQRLGHIALIPKLRTMTRVDEYLRQHQIERHIVYTSSKFWSFPHMIATTDLIAQLPGDFAREAAKFYPLQLLPMPFDFPEQQVYMIWKENRSNDAAHRWLRQQIAGAFNDYNNSND